MRTTLGDLEICESLAGQPKSGNGGVFPFVGNSFPSVDAGEFALGLGVAFRVAAGYYDLGEIAALLQSERTRNLSLRFFAGRFDERAGIDYANVRAIGIGAEGISGLDHPPCAELQIHRVLGATERNERHRFIFLHVRPPPDRTVLRPTGRRQV